MCGRFQVDPENDAIRKIQEEQLRLPGQENLELASGEISPTDVVLVLTKEGAFIRPLPMSWGFPRWLAKGVVFNARAETVMRKPMFRNHLLSRPVAIPTTGFYEWKSVPGAKSKDKYLFREPGQPLLYLAGFARTVPNRSGRTPDCFTILTTAANREMAPYHDRMPVLLHPGEIEAWIAGDELGYFLERIPFALEAARV